MAILGGAALRHLVLVLLLWVCYDFGDPAVPGAVVFDADQCLDAIEKRVLLPQDHVIPPLPASDWERIESLEVVPAPVSLLRHEPPPSFALHPPRRTDASPPDPGRSVEDH
jgi:hypothetical protein